MDKNNKVIAVDTEGLDNGFEVMVRAAIEFVKDYTDVKLRLFVLEENVERAKALVGKNDRITLVESKAAAKATLDTKIILNDAHESLKKLESSKSVKEKEKSKDKEKTETSKSDSTKTTQFSSGYSMTDTVYDVYSKTSDACVIAGHAGHLVFVSRSMERHFGSFNAALPQCLAGNIPTLGKAPRIMLDLGGLVNQDLFKIAVLGSAFMKSALGFEGPKLGFLNIGTEYNKGKLEIREAAQKYAEHSPDEVYGEHGFIEPDQIYRDNNCNVIVTDGFTGNAVLKASEGVSKVINALIKSALKSSLIAHILALPLKHLLHKVYSRMNPDRYNTAILLGFNALIIKCHGGSEEKSLYSTLVNARNSMQTFPKFLEAQKDLFKE